MSYPGWWLINDEAGWWSLIWRVILLRWFLKFFINHVVRLRWPIRCRHGFRFLTDASWLVNSRLFMKTERINLPQIHFRETLLCLRHISWLSLLRETYWPWTDYLRLYENYFRFEYSNYWERKMDMASRTPYGGRRVTIPELPDDEYNQRNPHRTIERNFDEGRGLVLILIV